MDINNEIILAPDAREKIEEALRQRQRAARPRNREERRALMNKIGKKAYNEIEVISETATKLDYIDLIQKLRELNKKKENENYEVSDEDD